MARRSRTMIRGYGDDLRLLRSRGARVGMLVVLALYLVLPWHLSDFWASVLTLAGITAVGALGLNLLTGYTGQTSLGSAAFIGLGAFTASYLGRGADFNGKSWPFLAYLLVAAVLGGLVGLVVGLPALRLRGNYLVIVTLGLTFIALYVFKGGEHGIFKFFADVSGGNAGAPVPQDVKIGGLNFTRLELFGHTFSRNQGYFYVVWALVGVVGLLVTNIVRSRPGRALQAVRDRDVAAEVVGVSLFRYKVGAFVISSAVLSMAGVLYGIWIQYLVADSDQLGLTLSIQYLAIIVVGGIGTTYGPVLGALLVGSTPALIDQFASRIPFVTESPATESGISKPALQAGLYAVLIIVFLVTEPQGLAGIWRRTRAYFSSWPFPAGR